ncbi:MAG: hypothetical protein ABIO70_30250 [Pseudomonadota bacterium]
MRPSTAFFSLTFLLAGCIENTPYRAEQTDTFFQEPPSDVDILWVIDNSPSMAQEQEEVGRRFAEFIGHLEGTNIDFHLGIVTTDMDEDNPDAAHLIGDPPVIDADVPGYQEVFNARVQVGIDGSDQERGLEAAYQALTEPVVSDANAGFLRREATLSIIFVSDENDCSDRGALPSGADGAACYTDAGLLAPIRDFVEDYRALKDDPSAVIASAIVGPDINEGCVDSVPGTRYRSVAENTGGIEGNICDEDFTGIMDEMGLSVSGVRSSFELSKVPVLETLGVWVGDPDDDISTWEEVFEDEATGWTYDAETYFLIFHGAAVPARGSAITVTYEVAGSHE